jgi:phosphatidate cytidylyltransferase
MAFGAIYTSLPFGAFVWIREDVPDGRMVLMALLAIVWATDIAAYFAGRGFGGPLLSPKDSPNKTWTGAIGALVCAALAGGAVARAAGGDFMHWVFARSLRRQVTFWSRASSGSTASRIHRASCPAMAACSTGLMP